MIRLRASLDTRKVGRGFKRLAFRTPDIIAQELNRQRRAFRGGTGKGRLPVVGLPRRLAALTSIKPLKRLRRRVLEPRAGNATRRKLNAGGLTLYESLPSRYWKGKPGQGELKDVVADPSGRQPVGGMFLVALKSGARGQMKRFTPQEWTRMRPDKNPKTNYLPINWAQYVDLTPNAYPARLRVLRDLARFWPAQMSRRLRSEFRGIFRRA